MAKNKKRRQKQIKNFLDRFFDKIRGVQVSKNSRKTKKSKRFLKKPVVDSNKDEEKNVQRKTSDLHSDSKRKPKKRRKKTLDNFLKKFFRERRIRKEEKEKRKLKKKIIQKRKKRFRKKERIRWWNKIMNFLFPKTEHVPYQAAAPVDKKYRIKRNIFNLLNSLFVFVISYLIVYLFYQFVVLFVASWYNLDSILYFYDLAFNDYSPLWTRFNIILITFSGPAASFVVGSFFLRVFFKKKGLSNMQRLFILWIGLHALNMFFGAFVAGVTTDQGFGYVANWLYMNAFFKILLSLISLVILTIIGYYSTRHFLETASSTNRIIKKHRLQFLFIQALLPWLIGSLLLFFIKFPFIPPYETVMICAMAFLIVPVVFNSKAKPILKIIERKRKTKILWVYFTIFIIFLLLFRIGLYSGLHFIIKMSVTITPL
jgi:hypothetical protein